MLWGWPSVPHPFRAGKSPPLSTRTGGAGCPSAPGAQGPKAPQGSSCLLCRTRHLEGSLGGQGDLPGGQQAQETQVGGALGLRG